MTYLTGKEIILYARSIAPSSGKKERSILNFISNNYLEIPNLSIVDLACNLNVSEATITKACKKLKCKGFYELKHLIEKYISTKKVNSKEQDEQEDYLLTDSNYAILEKVFINSTIALQDTFSGINTLSFERAVNILINLSPTSKIILIGSGGSGILCEDFQHKLLKIGIVAIMFKDSNMQLMSTSLTNKNDVVIGISHSGTTKSVIEALKLSKAHGAKTICITNHALSPITTVATVSLHTSAKNSPLSGENAAARIAQLSILDALYTILVLHHNKISYSNLQKTQKSVQSRRTSFNGG